MGKYSFHVEVERRERLEFIQKNIGYGKPCAFVFHKSETARQAHREELSDTGILTVYAEDWSVITIHIASFPQAMAIYRKANKTEPPEWIKRQFQTAQRYKDIEP